MSIENIQPENGWAPIANDLAEAFATRDIPSTTMRVMWVILREVYGRIQNRGTSSATIPTSQFIATTHLPRNRIYEALAWLEKEGLISRVGEISENQDIRKSGYKISGKTVIHIRKSGVLCPEIRISHSLNSNSNKPLRVRKEIRNKEKEKERDATLFKRRNSARLTPSIFED